MPARGRYGQYLYRPYHSAPVCHHPATGAVIVTVAGGMKALGALIITAFIIYGLGRYFRHHLGGQTGDTLGAAEECGEIIFLLALFWV